MNNKGFIFIETIITVVVLTTTLVLLYASYNNVIITEKRRLYHDDIAYVYKTQHIRDILDLTLDYVKFNEAVEYKLNGAPLNERMYMYVFNVESDIYKNNALITEAKNLYKFYRLVYIKIADIPTIKSCIKDGKNGVSLSDKCRNTLNFANAHGYSYLEDYLLTLDVPTDATSSYKGHEGILISLIYETKSGDVKSDSNNVVQIGTGKYSECIIEKVRGHFNIYYPGAGASQTLKQNYENQMIEKMKEYNNDDKLNFNMQCENAYYLSWVYL